jgi:predicted ArsR family transcriptional regulator
VLALLYREGDLTARVIANELGVTERTVPRIMHDLIAEGYIERRREGRRNTYRINLELSLRRADQHGVTVGELLKVLRSPGDTKPSKARPKF